MTAVVALAGHVDHGKSALVTAITGHTTDRLANERASGHTIEVHAAHLPDSTTTLLDAPGHEGWTTATLAGLGAATHALLVVAADDGVMPQTVDHATAVVALRLPLLAVAVTRTDLVDAGRVTETIDAVHRLLRRIDPAGTTAPRAHGLHATEVPVAPVVPVVPTSIRTGRGIPQLVDVLGTARAAPTGTSLAGPDLWVDTSFHVPGHGIVALGTLRHGAVMHGASLAGSNGTVRVRGVQQRGHDVDQVAAPARVALRLAGAAELPRGTRLLDPMVHRHGLVALPADALVDNLGDEVVGDGGGWTLHTGTGHQAVRVRPRTDIAPGDRGLATLVADPGSRRDRPSMAADGSVLRLRPGDRFVLRDTGRRRVTAGGVVLCPTGRGDEARLRLAREFAAGTGSDGDRSGLAAALADCHGGVLSARAVAAVLGPGDTGHVDAPVVAPALHEALVAAVDTAVQAGGPDGRRRAAVASRIVHEGPGDDHVATAWRALDRSLRAAAVAAVVDEAVAAGRLVQQGPRLHPLGTGSAHADATAATDAVAAELTRGGRTPDPVRMVLARADASSADLHALVRSGSVHLATRGYAFHADAVADAVTVIEGLPAGFTVADARDALAITRRHAVPLLELCDRLGVTTRDEQGRRTVATATREG